MVATADLAGEDAPALFTVGRDGAVFYWMYDPAPPGTRSTPQGYAQVPGKHRKRKAPDTDPIQPKAASAGGKKAAVRDKGVVAIDEEDLGSSSGGSSDASEERAPVEAGHGSAAGAWADVTEDGTHIQASTSGRGNEDQQQQTLSFAGDQSKLCCTSKVAIPFAMQAPPASAHFSLHPTICTILPCPALLCPVKICPALRSTVAAPDH